MSIFLRVLAICLLLAGTARAADLSPIRAEGTHLVDRDGKPVILRGCNIGNWFLIETWMAQWYVIRDHHQVEQVLSERFGKEQKDRWMEQYREGFMQDRDWELIRSFGMNCVRLPLHYQLALGDEAPYRLRSDAFKWIDRAVDAAERHGIYVILDLHGAPGAQSKDQCAGWADQNRLWSDRQCQVAMAEFWRETAKRYRGRSVVAGYDILNEPYGDYRSDMSKPMLALAREVYQAIRDTGDEHVVFLPGIIHGGIRIYDGQIADMQQVALTQHHYPGLFGDQGSLRRQSWFLHREMDDLDRFVEKMNRPLLVGEFNVPLYESGGPYMLRLHFDRYAKSGWAATMWSYKILKPEPGVGDGNWYLVSNGSPMPRVDLKTSSKEEIAAYFDAIGKVELSPDQKLRGLMTSSIPPDLPLDMPPELPKAAPTDPAPAPWTAADIGGGLPGGQTFRPNGTIEVCAAGRDIYGTGDAFHFISQAAEGDCTIEATARSLLESAQYAKAGVMLRSDQSPESAHVMLNVFPDSTIALTYRPAAGQPTQERKFHIEQMPISLKLARTGDVVTASFAGEDGKWTMAGKVKLAGPCRAGLAVSSHSAGQLTRAIFADVKVTGAKP